MTEETSLFTEAGISGVASWVLRFLHRYNEFISQKSCTSSSSQGSVLPGPNGALALPSKFRLNNFQLGSVVPFCHHLKSHMQGFQMSADHMKTPFHRRQHWKTEQRFLCHRHFYAIVTFINVNMHHQEGDGWLGNNVSYLSYSSSSPSTFITALPEDFYSLPKMDFSNNSSGFLLLKFPQFPRKYSTSLFSIAKSSLPLWSLKLICLDEKELLEIGLKWHILMMILILGAMMLIFTFNR